MEDAMMWFHALSVEEEWNLPNTTIPYHYKVFCTKQCNRIFPADQFLLKMDELEEDGEDISPYQVMIDHMERML